VTIKPQAADFQEALAYDIDQPTSESAVVTMRWEKIAVPFKVAVNVNEMVEDSLHKQLRDSRSTPGTAGMTPPTTCWRTR